MIKSCDSGSLPPVGDFEKFMDGAKNFCKNGESAEYFERRVVSSFIDKIRVGIDVPNYPQFRDMNTMFFEMIDGVEKFEDGYLMSSVPSLKADNCHVPEILALERNSERIHEEKGENFEIRVCITGPYTLASFFPYRDECIFSRLGNVISEILETNLFSNDYGKTSLVSVDEPLFGLVDDTLIDFGSNGREDLLSAWETIFSIIRSKKAQTMMHLHSTTNELFWHIDSLQVIDSHVDDPLIERKKTCSMLESKDKFLKASLTANDFDKLIEARIVAAPSQKLSDSDVSEKIADVWNKIKNEQTDPNVFLDSIQIMKRRLTSVVKRFGVDRILFAGPECGLKGYPTYENALECLKRVADTIVAFNKEL